MKTIKLTENGVEVEYQLTPIIKDLEIQSGILRCANCEQVYSSFEDHECKPKFKVWKPKQGKSCYWIASDSIQYSGYDRGEYKFLNFETHEQAKEFVEKMKFNYEVEMFIKEKNEGWEVDFYNEEIDKYLLVYNYVLAEIDIEGPIYIQSTSLNKYFKTRKIGEEILAKFDNDKLIKYWI